MTGRPIVFGVLMADALERWPGRNLLMRALTQFTSVVLLEEMDPKAGQWRLARPRIEEVAHNLYVVRNAGSVRRPRRRRLVEPVDRILESQGIRRELEAQGLGDYLLWMTVPDVALRRRFNPSVFVYDCMDPNFLPEKQQQHDRALEKLGGEAQLVFCSAHALLDRMQEVNGVCYLLPNAADEAAMRPDPLVRERWKRELRLGSRPVVGYLGTLDWRVDPSIVELVSQLQEFDFVIGGRVNAEQQNTAKALATLHNVRLTGQVGYDDGYALNALFDVGLIPFTPGPVNDCVNSVKMFMYLAAGVPVVSTDLRESRCNEWVHVGTGPNDMARLIRHAVSHDNAERRALRRSFAAANTWESRAAEAWSALGQAGLLPP